MPFDPTDLPPSAADTAPSLPTRLLQSARFWRWLLAVLVVVVGYLALTPNPPSDLESGWDKLNHMMAFAALSLSAFFTGPQKGRRVLGEALALLAFGGAIEIIQSFVGRDAEWGDLAADAVGITIGLAIAWALKRWLLRPAR